MKLYVYGKRISLQRFIKQVAFFFIYPFFFFLFGKNKGFSLRQVLTAVSIIAIHADI